MRIRKSTIDDLNRIMELFSDAREYMAENGNPNQWKKTWPPAELIEEDIKQDKSYVCVEETQEGERIIGTFFYDDGPDHTYDKIYDGAWKDDIRPYRVVHRITTDRNTRGVGSFCLNWAYDNFQNIRIDTHRDNKPMQGLLGKLGFEYCGIIYLENGEERIAFQKI